VIGRGLWNLVRLLVVSGLAVIVIGAIVLDYWTVPDPFLPPESPETAWVNTDALNVRAEPSLDGGILDVFPNGTSVSVLGESRNGYLPVAYGTDRAWVFADYISRDESESGSLDFGPAVEHASAAPATDAGVTASKPVPPPPYPTEPPTVPAPAGEHWIDVDRGSATVTLFIGDQAQASFPAKIGWDLSDDGFYSTAVGTYHVFTMNGGLSSTPFVDDVYMTEFVGFDPNRHNGFHSPIRDADGTIRSHQNATTLGCVRLDEQAASELFTFAFIGMRVEIHN
jgi:lipoprotein-anchoring transpeptidase ErfK/SrfK